MAIALTACQEQNHNIPLEHQSGFEVSNPGKFDTDFSIPQDSIWNMYKTRLETDPTD